MAAVCAALAPMAALHAAAPASPIPLPAEPFRAPFVPSRDDEILQEVPSADGEVAAIRRLRAALDARPRDLAIANDLAKAYIDFGRRLGDAHYVGYAEAVIAPWFARPGPPASTLVLHATIVQYRHRFDEARRDLSRAIAVDGSNVQAWLTLATLDMVQGDYAAAARDCERVGRFGGTPLGLICSANLASYLGQARQGMATLVALEGARGTLPDAYGPWVDGLIAESAERLGDWKTVEAHYRAALAVAPKDNFLLVAYADFLLDRGRASEVLSLLADQAQSDTAFLRLVLAQAMLGSPDLPRYVWVMSARFEALAQRGDDLFGREQVRFALHAQHDAAGALRLAEQNWKVQRAPWDARVFLEAALAADRPDAAVPVLDFVDRTKLEDPVIARLVVALRQRMPRVAS